MGRSQPAINAWKGDYHGDYGGSITLGVFALRNRRFLRVLRTGLERCWSGHKTGGGRAIEKRET
jgi:hypothetical protein